MIIFILKKNDFSLKYYRQKNDEITYIISEHSVELMSLPIKVKQTKTLTKVVSRQHCKVWKKINFFDREYVKSWKFDQILGLSSLLAFVHVLKKWIYL